MSAGTSVLYCHLLFQGKVLSYIRVCIALTGGLAFSTILTPTVVPALMALLTLIVVRNDLQVNKKLLS